MIATPASGSVPQGWLSLTGSIRAVTYHGATPRYAVAVDGGGELAVMRQNAGESLNAAQLGDAVRLAWPRQLNQPLDEGI